MIKKPEIPGKGEKPEKPHKVEPFTFGELITLSNSLYTSYYASGEYENWKKMHGERATSAHDKIMKLQSNIVWFSDVDLDL